MYLVELERDIRQTNTAAKPLRGYETLSPLLN